MRNLRLPFHLEKALLASGAFLCFCSLGITLGLTQSIPSSPLDGEKLDFEVTYQWGPIYLEVGDVSFTTQRLDYADVQLWSFEGWGTSRAHWNWFYPVNSIYTSLANTMLDPLNFHRKGREGSHRYDRWYFLKDSTRISWVSHDDELSNGELIPTQSSKAIHDVMTAVHWCRHLDWPSARPGESTPMNLILDGEIHQTTISFQGIQEWIHPKTQETHTCWVFEPVLIEGTVFKAGDRMRVFVTADERRLPVFVETELVVGAARIYLEGESQLSISEMQAHRKHSQSERDEFFVR